MVEPADDVTMTFGGTATMLLRIGGFTLLTDPNFLHRGQKARLGYGLRARRLTEPALLPAQLIFIRRNDGRRGSLTAREARGRFVGSRALRYHPPPKCCGL